MPATSVDKPEHDDPAKVRGGIGNILVISKAC
jgi:hypothetical protein